MLVLHAHQEFLQKHLNIWKKLEDADKRELLAATSLVVYKQQERCNGRSRRKAASSGSDEDANNPYRCFQNASSVME